MAIDYQQLLILSILATMKTIHHDEKKETNAVYMALATSAIKSTRKRLQEGTQKSYLASSEAENLYHRRRKTNLSGFIQRFLWYLC